jgi:hypothetical protein
VRLVGEVDDGRVVAATAVERSAPDVAADIENVHLTDPAAPLDLGPAAVPRRAVRRQQL